MAQLLRALVNPRTNQSDLFRRERLGWRSESTSTKSARTTGATRTARAAFSARSASGGIAATGTTRRTIARSALSTGSARPTGSTGAACSTLESNSELVLTLCDKDQQETIFADP